MAAGREGERCHVMRDTAPALVRYERLSNWPPERGVKYLTLFAFSSENWARPREEVSKLMSLFVEALQREVDELHRNNVRLEFIGAREQLQAGLIEKITSAEAQTAGNTGLRLIVAVAYGGRWDIVRATQSLAGKVAAGEFDVSSIDDEALAAELQLTGCTGSRFVDSDRGGTANQ